MAATVKSERQQVLQVYRMVYCTVRSPAVHVNAPVYIHTVKLPVLVPIPFANLN